MILAPTLLEVFMFVHLGPDRVEFWDPIQRPFRMGAWDQVTTSDVEMVRQLIKAPDWQRASDLARNYYYPNAMFMCYAACEWLSQWPIHLRKSFPQQAMSIFQDAHKEWGKFAKRLEKEDPSAYAIVSFSISSAEIMDTSEPLSVPYDPIWKGSRERFEACVKSMDTQNRNASIQNLEAFHTSARLCHDLLLEYLAQLVNTSLQTLGQDETEAALSATMQACVFNEGMWKVCEKLQPHELAALLAEHLRFHFSGAGRDGSVRVVEEADRIRLIFDPCGSGGAMRRTLGVGETGLHVMPKATGATWGLAGCVPGYCTHCAQNEMASVRRLGYPAWVTEFNPDSSQPCGWTIFKDPAKIPDRYFERLGLKRNGAV